VVQKTFYSNSPSAFSIKMPRKWSKRLFFDFKEKKNSCALQAKGNSFKGKFPSEI